MNTRATNSNLSYQIQKIRSIPLLSKDEEFWIATKAWQGEALAQDRLVHHNLRLVAHIASSYRSHSTTEELIGEGTLGLIKASKLFNPNRGYSFASFSAFYIRAAMLHYMRETYSPLHIPKNKFKELRELHELRPNSHSSAFSFESFENLTEEERSRCQSTYRTSRSILPEEQFRQKSISESLRQCLNKLPDLSRRIISSYFGLDCPKKSMREIGRELNQSRSAVDQAYASGMCTLRKLCSQANLRDLVF